MKVFKPPHFENPSEYEGKKIFLGGSIEMGKAKDWQKEIENSFKNEKVTFFNPRRDDWDSSWEQTIENDQFRTQVMWELDHLLKCDIALFFIEGTTKSPITLMEIGLLSIPHTEGKTKVLICCEEGFWRRGNVEVMAYKFNMPLVSTLSELKKKLKDMLKDGK